MDNTFREWKMIGLRESGCIDAPERAGLFGLANAMKAAETIVDEQACHFDKGEWRVQSGALVLWSKFDGEEVPLVKIWPTYRRTTE